MSEDALRRLAAMLRDEDTVISPHVLEPQAEPALGMLAAAGPRTAHAATDYALLVEAIREGYLLHYGTPRVVGGPDGDLHLLAGDYLYALGLERLAALGDVEAVRELSDLISLCAQLHTEARDRDAAGALWLASVVAVAAGPPDGHEAAKASLRAAAPNPDALTQTTADLGSATFTRAREAGIDDALARAAEAIDFAGLRDG